MPQLEIPKNRKNFQNWAEISLPGHFLNLKCVGTAFVCINRFFIGYWILKAGWISILALFFRTSSSP